MSERTRLYAHPAFNGVIGVGRRDITPPVGIYARSWGAATSARARGIHRALTVTALALSRQRHTAPLILLALDLGWWQTPQDEWAIRDPVREALAVAPSQVLLHLSHTHAGPSLSAEDADKPGGALIAPYRDAVARAAIDAAQEALATSREATLTWATGSCHLAQNRDLYDGVRHVCGFNPAAPADSTLLVGRVTDAAGTIRATLVNYACHPTTLAWQNQLISPDFVGALREDVENATQQAPCLFLQGASGDLAPRDQYTGATAQADTNGRVLALAVRATLEGMLPPGVALAYTGVVESGAPLGVWAVRPYPASTTLRAHQIMVDLALQPQAAPASVLDDWVWTERAARAQHVLQGVGSGRSAAVPLWLWRLGDALLVGQPNEAYSALQTTLRRRFPDQAIVVLNLAGGYGPGYLPPATMYDAVDLYAIWQTPFARGSLERLVAAATEGIERALRGDAQHEGTD